MKIARQPSRAVGELQRLQIKRPGFDRAALLIRSRNVSRLQLELFVQRLVIESAEDAQVVSSGRKLQHRGALICEVVRLAQLALGVEAVVCLDPGTLFTE